MKLIDFDGIFDRKVSEYIAKNPGKYSEEKWSDILPKLYEKFGNTFIRSINTTPNLYYTIMTDKELADTLKAHIQNEVPVSDFLARELENRSETPAVSALLYDDDERVVKAIAEACGDGKEALKGCLNIVCGNYSEDIKDIAAEKVRNAPDKVKDELKKMYLDGKEKEFATELLSSVKEKDDEIFNLLLNDFLENLDDIPKRADFLASYGDERAVPYLMEQIKHEDINYLEFRELKYAIETLGGEYNETRDFSGDKYYQQICAVSEIEITSALNEALSGEEEKESESEI